ncbi:MAG TPA: hypothetical protein DEB56_03775 [Thiobacillus sp.]|nr:hypothetical protein [Thiobacillus sp.]
MSTIQDLFQQAQLAQAAYADLTGTAENQTALLARLDVANKDTYNGTFSQSQAAEFVKHWRVVSHQPDTSSGFSATLFERLNSEPQPTGQYTLAIRGSSEPADWTADFFDLALGGVAYGQVQSMVNYVLRLQAGSLGTTQQVEPTLVAGAPTLSSASVSGEGPGINPSMLTVSGHSLGGYLAQIYQRIFGSAGVYTYNSLGVPQPDAQILNYFTSLLGLPAGNFSSGTGENLMVPGEPAQLVGTIQGKPQIAIFTETESATINPIDTAPAHYKEPVVDALALYSLFATIDPALNTANPAGGIATITRILKAASADPAQSLELTLDALRTLFQQNYQYGHLDYDAVPTMVGSDATGRNDYYTKLQSLQTWWEASPFTALTVKPLAELSGNQIADLAMADTADGQAYRYAIYKLNPFAITDSSVLYDGINAHGELDLYDPATGRGNLTDQYIKDRAAMQSWKQHFAYDDIQPVGGTFVKPQSGTPFYFEDETTDTQIRIGGSLSVGGVLSRPLSAFRIVVFGSQNADAMTGQDKSDFLYGGASADTLTGNGGNDYMEGGSGFDTYVISAGDGFDTILDTDGTGVIKLVGVLAKGSATAGLDPAKWKQLGADLWVDTQNGITYRKVIVDGESQLLIHKGDSNVLVKGWSDSELGITLGAGSAPVSPVTTRTYSGDQHAPLKSDGSYEWSATAWLTDGTLAGGVAEANFNDVIYGSAGADRMDGLGGNDALDGGAGTDRIDGGDGDDLIGGGAGSDLIYGGIGNDVILSATGLAAPGRSKPSDVWTPPAGTTVWTKGSTWGVYQNAGGFTLSGGGSLTQDDAPDVIYAGDGNDHATGGRGDDFIDGGIGNDTLWGNGGNDIIDGGAGDDLITGDGTTSSGFYSTTPESLHGDDILIGGAGTDKIWGGGGHDLLLGGAENDTLMGEAGHDVLDGGLGADYLAGGDGHDTYLNVTGEDTILDNKGSNTIRIAAAGIDTAGLTASVETNEGGQQYMQVQIDLDSGGALKLDSPFWAVETTTLEFSGGEVFDLEVLIGEQLFTPLHLILGVEGGRVFGGAGDDTLEGRAGDDTLLGYAGDDTLSGNDGADTLAGGAGVDYLEGGAGDDALDGGEGDDTLDGGVGNDTLQAGAGDDRLYGGEGADTLLADDGSDWLSGGDGTDILEGGAGDDYLVGGTGDDVYRLSMGAGWDTIEDTEGRNRIEFAADIGLESLSLTRSVHGYEIAYGYGWDAVNVSSTWALSPNELKFADATYVLSNELFTGVPVPVWGDEADNVLVDLGPGVEFSGGWGGDDTLIGGAGDNVYYFDLGDGSDVTVDLGGVDTISFGEGITPDDVFVEYGDLGNQLPGLRVYVGSDGDVISIQNGESSILENFQFSDGLTLTFDEMLAWQGGLHTVPAGTTGERHGERLLAGTDGDDALDSPFSYSEGGSGVAYVGGLGDDAIVASVRTGSLFLLNQGDGNDTIRRVEIDAYGAPDALVFGAGITPESLSFSFVERTVTGDGGPFIGVTTYTVTDAVFQYGSAGDSVTMLADSLADLNFMFADGRVGTYSALTSGQSVVTGGIGRGPFDLPPGDDAHPALYWSGTTDDDTYAARDMLSVNGQTAKPQRDVVDGGAGNDHIATRAGNDWLTGGQGNDLLEGGTGSDVYVFAEGDGADTIRETTAAGEKNYVLIEGEVAPTFEYDGSDLLVHYNNGADVIRVEHFFSSGLDEHAAISGVLLDRSAAGVYPLEIFYSLDDIKAAVHIKNGSPDDDTLVGSAANDFLFGNAGADTLQGSKGDDTLIGGAGDDTYVINLGDGVDTIRDSFAEGENNTIVFGAGVDPGLVKLFKGSLGLDLGGGNTVHIEGVDYDDLANTSSIRNFMFADGTALTIEQLLARGFDLNGSDEADTLSGTSASDRIEGGAGNDNLSGLAGNDVLDGNAGNDTLAGGAGDDTYIVDSTGDHVMENAGEGTDSIQSSVTLTLAANVENLALTGAAAINGTGNELGNVLTGNSANNRLVGGLGNDTLIGGSGHDRLDGGAGADTMAGGLGNDAYVVDDAGDVVTENAGEGSDSVEIYAAADFILDANLENGYRRGTGSWTTMGNAENNFLSGNSGNDTLIGLGGNDRLLGGVGADTLIGGMGDDTYFVDDANDVVTELANAGVDHVHVWKSMAYTLAANVENGSLGQVSGSLTGNALDNSLNGSWSDDVLDGGGGADTLAGSGGNDTYVVGRDYGTDTVIENDTTAGNTDVAQFLAGVASDQIWFLQVGNNLEASIIGTSDKLVIQDWYLGSANHVEQFKTTDGARTLLDSNVQNLVNAMASFAPPAAGQTTLPPNYQNMLADVIAANWQ